MTVEETRFITEMLRAIRGDIAGLDRRMTNIELRQTALEQRLSGIDTHLMALQLSIDETRSDMRRVKQRLELVDGEA